MDTSTCFRVYMNLHWTSKITLIIVPLCIQIDDIVTLKHYTIVTLLCLQLNSDIETMPINTSTILFIPLIVDLTKETSSHLLSISFDNFCKACLNSVFQS